MAKGRIRNRLELRAQAEAAERRRRDDGDAEEEEEEDEAEGEAAEAGDEEAAEEEEAEAEPPKKKKPPAKPAKPRTRTAKAVRMKVVWGVFNNSNQRVAVYDYPKRKEAEEHAAKLATDKKGTFFVQPIKEPIEDKKEA
jgi:cobalamin biosynthesis protein CobT